MASLNYMQTTTFKFCLRFFILYYNFGAAALAARMLYALCVFHKGSILWAKVKMSMQYQRKHISPNFNLLQNYFLRCHFFILRMQQRWDLKQMVDHNSQDTPWTIFSNVLCSLAFLFNDNHLLKNASCKVWLLDMVSKVFQDIWANSKIESGLYYNMSIIGWNCDRKCNRNRLIVRDNSVPSLPCNQRKCTHSHRCDPS